MGESPPEKTDRDPADETAKVQYLEFITDYVIGLNRTYDGRIIGLIASVSVANFVVAALLNVSDTIPSLSREVQGILLFAVAFLYVALFLLIFGIRPRSADPNSPAGTLQIALKGARDLEDHLQTIKYGDIIANLAEEMVATAVVAEVKGRWINRSLVPLSLGFGLLFLAFAVLVVAPR